MNEKKRYSILTKIGHIQTIIIIGILYVIIGGIAALMMKLFRSRPMDIPLTNGSYWTERKQKKAELDIFYNQF